MKSKVIIEQNENLGEGVNLVENLFGVKKYLEGKYKNEMNNKMCGKRLIKDRMIFREKNNTQVKKHL